MKNFNLVCLLLVLTFTSICLSIPGQGFHFTGNNYIKVGGNLRWYERNDFTLEFWMKADANNVRYAGIVQAIYFTVNDHFGFGVEMGGPNSIMGLVAQPTFNTNTDHPITINRWTHVALTRESGSRRQYRLYVNGVLAQVSGVGSTASVAFSPLITGFYIGRHHDNDEDIRFKGSVDEVRLWSIVKTPERILAEKDSCLTGREAGLVAYFPFTHTSGRTLTDAKVGGSNLDGVVVGDVRWERTCDTAFSCCTPGGGGSMCFSTPEICNDGVDNDCDGQIDCSDSDCNGASACAVGCDTCSSPSDCPDIILDAGRLQSSMEIISRTFSASSCPVLEGCASAGTRKLLRFDTLTANVGTGDLTLGVPQEPGFEYDQCHRHFHLRGYAAYTILKGSETVSVGHKQAFCLLDSIAYDTSIAQIQGVTLHNCSYQGINKGYADVYTKTLDCQWVDITDLDEGNYNLRVEINAPKADGCRDFAELEYTNNVNFIPFTVGNPGSCETCPGFYGSNIPPYGFIDPTTQPNVYEGPSLPGDDGWVDVVLPFDFPFYCDKVNRISICSNGFISLKGRVTGNIYNEGASPNQCKNNCICVLWDDWNALPLRATAPGAGIYYGYNAGLRAYIVTWNKIPHYGANGATDHVTFQAHLYDDGKIDMFYPDTTTVSGSFSGGLSATVGVQGANAVDNKIISYHSTIPDRSSRRILPPINTRPVARAGGPYSGIVGELIQFDGAASTDAENHRLEYMWTFGDGNDVPGSNAVPTHRYSQPGVYEIVLTVSDFPTNCAPGLTSEQSVSTVTISDGAPPCGNGVCSGSENACNCAIDCPSRCGDGVCCALDKENACNCPADCGQSTCGDGVCCRSSENSCNCPSDCGDSYCGDGVCCGGEDKCNCPSDCPSTASCLRNSRCNNNSDCASTVCNNRGRCQ